MWREHYCISQWGESILLRANEERAAFASANEERALLHQPMRSEHFAKSKWGESSIWISQWGERSICISQCGEGLCFACRGRRMSGAWVRSGWARTGRDDRASAHARAGRWGAPATWMWLCCSGVLWCLWCIAADDKSIAKHQHVRSLRLAKEGGGGFASCLIKT